jgi:uncharacterized membrane protein
MRQWPFVIAGLATLVGMNAALLYLGEFHFLAYLVGTGTGALITAMGMIAEEYNKRSSGKPSH